MMEKELFLTDLSGNGNHGSVIGAEWSIDAPELDSSEPSISISPESYDFGQVIYGDTLETVFTIYNNGDFPLQYSTDIFEANDRNSNSDIFPEFTIPNGFRPGNFSEDQFVHLSTLEAGSK